MTGVSTPSLLIYSSMLIDIHIHAILEVTNIIFCIQLLHAPLHSMLIIATTPSYREALIRYVILITYI